MRYKILLFLIIAGLLCHSCSYKQEHVLFEQKTAATAQQQAPVLEPYKIKPDDILQIRNLQNIKYLANDNPVNGATSATASEGQTFQVEEDGRVTLPVIGHVPVSGLTRSEAAKKIEKIYRDSLLNNPIIELKILNLKVTVLGEVKTQGNFPLIKEKTTLIDVIGQAGGLSQTADEKTIKIIRGGQQNPQTIWVDLSDVNILSNPKIILQDNDVIYVAQNKRAVRNDKLQNFSTVAQPTLLILNTALILYTLFRK